LELPFVFINKVIVGSIIYVYHLKKNMRINTQNNPLEEMDKTFKDGTIPLYDYIGFKSKHPEISQPFYDEMYRLKLFSEMTRFWNQLHIEGRKSIVRRFDLVDGTVLWIPKEFRHMI
jgi:hypothetical protein